MSVFLNAALDDGPVASPAASGPTLVPISDAPDGHVREASAPAEPHDPARPVREFEAICAKHSLACGAPEDLAAFLRALDQNKLLAMNFWSVVARLSAGKDCHALTQEQLLAAIVHAVTGQPIEQVRESGEPQRQHIDQLARMLSGEDVSPSAAQAAPPQPADAQPQPLAPQPHDAPSPDPPSERSSYITQLHLAAAAPPEAARLPADESAPTAPSTTRPRLVLQPDHPRHIAAAVLAAAQAPAGPPEVSPNSMQKAPRVAPHAPAAARPPLRIEPEDEPRIAIPLSAYADRDDRGALARRAGIAVLGLVLLCGFGFLIARTVAAWRQPGNQTREGISSLTHRIAAFIHPSTAAPANAAPATTTPPSDTLSIPAAPAARSGASRDSAPRSNTSGHATAPAAASSQPVTSPSDNPSRSRQRRADRAADSDGSADSAGLANGSALVQVSAAEMRDHLVSSRFPIVPDAANADAVSGVVTLHVVITARGTVEHAYAISGPDNLRQPAIEAVAGWRYRPYLLNGTPVDVSTTIRVDFSGNE